MKKKRNLKRYFYLVFYIIATLAVLIFLSYFLIPIFHRMGLIEIAALNKNLISNLLIPTAFTSILFSSIAIVTIAFLVYNIKKVGSKEVFPFKGYAVAVSTLFIIFVINYFITLFPYGNLVLNIISFILQVMIYGLLLPYILSAQIVYIILLIKGDIDGSIK